MSFDRPIERQIDDRMNAAGQDPQHHVDDARVAEQRADAAGAEVPIDHRHNVAGADDGCLKRQSSFSFMRRLLIDTR